MTRRFIKAMLLAMAEDILFPLPTGAVAARVYHAGKAQRILALHGWLDNAASFEDLAQRLPNATFVAIDLPGHGLSAHKQAGYPYHLLDTFAVILGILDQLKWEKCILLGHSLGGAIASLFAGAFPDKVERLVSLEALGPFSAEAEGFAERLRKSYTDLASTTDKRLPVYENIERAIAVRMHVFPAEESGMRRIVERGLKKVEGGWTWRSDPRLRVDAPMRLTEAHVAELLKAIVCPTLLIEGTKGFHTSGISFTTRKPLVSNLTAHMIEGQHYPHLDSPTDTAHVIAGFLA